MADHYYGVSLGAMNDGDVTVDTSTTSSIIELRIEDGNSLTKLDVQNALSAIEQYLIKNSAPA